MNDEDIDIGVDIDRRPYVSTARGPFQEAAGLLTFYGGGGRAAIVGDIAANRAGMRRAVHVHGERGSGRTFLSLVLGDLLEGECNVIRHEPVGVPSVALLLRHLLIELCPAESGLIEPPGNAGAEAGAGAGAGTSAARSAGTIALATARVSERLRRPPPGGKPYLLIVDCRAAPDVALLALLDQLAGIRRAGGPAMHVVLFRPAAAAAVREGSLREEGHAGGGSYWLRRLTLAEVGDYLAHRMMLFDFNRRDLFTREMSYFVADRSEGVFGAIDTLVRHAFKLAALEDAASPSMSHLLAAGLPPRVERREGPLHALARHRHTAVALVGFCVVASSAVLVVLAR